MARAPRLNAAALLYTLSSAGGVRRGPRSALAYTASNMGTEWWLIHRTGSAGKDIDNIDLEQSIRDVFGVDDNFTWEIVHHQDWIARRMVAERFRVQNVFVCGDAAHLRIPFAGYGMNAGIADSTNLTRMMAAVLNGQAPGSLLDAHEPERHPITEQVSHLAMDKALEYMQRAQRRSIPKVIESPGFVGKILRSRLGKQLYNLNLPQFACKGLNFGYYYENSPIIQYDGESPPRNVSPLAVAKEEHFIAGFRVDLDDVVNRPRGFARIFKVMVAWAQLAYAGVRCIVFDGKRLDALFKLCRHRMKGGALIGEVGVTARRRTLHAQQDACRWWLRQVSHVCVPIGFSVAQTTNRFAIYDNVGQLGDVAVFNFGFFSFG